MKVGIFGLPVSGKTSVFRVLAGRADLATHDTHGDAQAAAVKLPDDRLEFVAEVYQPKKTTPAEITFVDTVALQKGRADARQAESLTELLGDADAFALVIRCFDLVADDAGAAAKDDLESLVLELALTDLAILERRLHRLEKDLESGRKEAEAEHQLLTRCREQLERGGLLSAVELSEGEEKAVRGFALLSMKPMLVVANIGEDQVAEAPLAEGGRLAALGQACEVMGLRPMAFCAELEAEIQELPPDEQEAFLSDYGIESPAREAFLRACFGLLGLVTFFTANENEVRAWTLPRGSTAVEAAGKVHTDMAQGFIKAEVISVDDLRECGTPAECRKQGKARLEGKEYEVQEGDILLIRFSH
jgi:GTP-binding protein YchF